MLSSSINIIFFLKEKITVASTLENCQDDIRVAFKIVDRYKLEIRD